MHILRSYTPIVYSLISIGSFIKEELRLREIWTDRAIPIYPKKHLWGYNYLHQGTKKSTLKTI